MGLNKEFGDKQLVPTGVSGDLPIGHETGSEASRQALLVQQAYLNELLDRSAAGQCTPDEEEQIGRLFMTDRAHGNS